MLALGALTAGVLAAQTGVTNASVSGVVKDKVTGQPLANYTVSTFVNVRWVGDTIMQNKNTKDVTANTDSSGHYKLTDLPPDSYRISARSAQHFGGEITRHVVVNGSDVEDVTFSGRSVMYEPLRPAAAMGGAGMRVTMAQDGATLNVQVNDADGNPGVDLRVLVIPADVRSEGELAARLVQGQTNQAGQYMSQTLPPGKYYVVATEETVDPAPESIGRLCGRAIASLKWICRPRVPRR